MTRCALVIVAALALVALVQASSLDERPAYKLKYDKKYDDRFEERSRFAEFLATKQRVADHNADPSRTFDKEINAFSDWRQYELTSTIRTIRKEKTLAKVANDEVRISFLSEFVGIRPDELEIEPPAELDWRSAGDRVTEIKNQLKCNCGYAFATAGLLEGQEITRNFSDKLVSLSAQQLVDCGKYGRGCFVGTPSFSLIDMGLVGGIYSDADYSYNGQENSCADETKRLVMKVDGQNSGHLSDAEIKMVLYRYGPVAAYMAKVKSLLDYKSGIFQDDHCENINEPHHVLLVGYGTDKTSGQDYWIAKNSWGQQWGEKGYFRLARGKNMCGINENLTVATFKS